MSCRHGWRFGRFWLIRLICLEPFRLCIHRGHQCIYSTSILHHCQVRYQHHYSRGKEYAGLTYMTLSCQEQIPSSLLEWHPELFDVSGTQMSTHLLQTPNTTVTAFPIICKRCNSSLLSFAHFTS
eukprot:PhF_6_TR36223/c1_g1_i1/m.52879